MAATKGIDQRRNHGPRLLQSLQELSVKYGEDRKRTRATIGLLKSVQTRVSADHRAKSPERKSVMQDAARAVLDDNEGSRNSVRGSVLGATRPRPVNLAYTRTMSTSDMRGLMADDEEMDEDNDGVISLEEAFRAHARAFGKEEPIMTVDEVVALLTRCELLDDLFTPIKIRLYFSTLEENCNHMVGKLKTAFSKDEIGYAHFESLLTWAADLKGVSFDSCTLNVIEQSLKLSDKSGNMMRKLHIVFEHFVKPDTQLMTSNEFALLFQNLDLYQHGKFTIGDVHLLFLQHQVNEGGVDINDFVNLVQIAGERLGIGNDIFRKFAEYIECQKIIQQNLGKIRLKMKHAAAGSSGPDWQRLFREADKNESGKIDWGEFLSMCRNSLHLSDRSSHLRVLFESLDEDGSGEITMEELIRFVGGYGPHSASHGLHIVTSPRAVETF